MKFKGLSKSKIQFEWKPNLEASQFRLDVGSEKGQTDIFTKNLGSQTWEMVDNIPLTGRSIFVRVWSKVNEEWVYADYEYKTKKSTKVPAQITKVVYTSDMANATLILIWNEGRGISQYRVGVGTQPGTADLYDENQGQKTQATVTNLRLDLEKIYLRLWSQGQGNWLYKDYIYDRETDQWDGQ